MAGVTTDGLLERLAAGPVICAEGYLFELERRGYLQAGAFVPEVVLEHPEIVAGLHEEFVHAGSDVVEAFTYYAHREKLRLIGKEDALESINRQALAIAADVARRTGSLLAGDICNTNVYDAADAASAAGVRTMFEEQVAWAVDAGADFIVGETFSWGEEALLATEVIRQTGLPAVITLAIHREPVTREGWTPAEACRRLEDAGADKHPRRFAKRRTADLHRRGEVALGGQALAGGKLAEADLLGDLLDGPLEGAPRTDRFEARLHGKHASARPMISPVLV